MKKQTKWIATALALVISGTGVQAQQHNKDSKNKESKTTVRTSSRSSTRQVNASGTVNRNEVTIKKDTRKITAYSKVPTGAQRVDYNNKTYHMKDGKFYTQSGARYTQVMPQRGMRVKTIPSNYQKISLGNILYYFLDGIFYNYNNSYYEVVNPQIGTVVNALPSDYEKVNYNGRVYYEYNSVLFEKINSRQYEVVGYLD